MLSYTKEVWKPILTLSKMSAMLSNGEKLLQEISFTLPKGAKLAVIGANGSGKSTLMQGVLGMIPTMFEKYLIAERPFLNIALKERARLLSYIGQQQTPEAETTVWEWCELSRFPHTTSKAENEFIIMEALTRCNALSFAGRRLMSLSGGERQRVYLAGILAQETPIIILDEVNAAMDPKYREEMEVLLHSLTDKTIISVTHDMNSLHHYSHLLALKSGRSIAFGETQAILTKDLLSELFDYPFTEVWHDDRVRYF